MRIERTGTVAALTPRVKKFIVEAISGNNLDNLQHPEEMKADYACLNGLVAVEIKTLEEDPTARIDNVVDELRRRDDWPLFLGSAPLDSFVKHLEDPEAARLRLLDRLGRAIISHLRKANKQLAAYEAAFSRKNIVRLMVLVNEDHEMYEPSVVGYILHHALNRTREDVLLYGNTDAVLYLSERHATLHRGQLTFPVLSVESANVGSALWKERVILHVLQKWADWSGTPLYQSNFADHHFTTIEHIPEKAPRHDRWEIDYRRNPYMQSWSTEEVRNRFDEAICIASLAFIKGSPQKPNHATIRNSMESMAHLMQEMGNRAIPVTQFRYSAVRLAEAGRRLGLDDHVVAWLENDCGRR